MNKVWLVTGSASGYSRLLWMRFYPRQTLTTLIRGLESALATWPESPVLNVNLVPRVSWNADRFGRVGDRLVLRECAPAAPDPHARTQCNAEHARSIRPEARRRTHPDHCRQISRESPPVADVPLADRSLRASLAHDRPIRPHRGASDAYRVAANTAILALQESPPIRLKALVRRRALAAIPTLADLLRRSTRTQEIGFHDCTRQRRQAVGLEIDGRQSKQSTLRLVPRSSSPRGGVDP